MRISEINVLLILLSTLIKKNINFMKVILSYPFSLFILARNIAFNQVGLIGKAPL